jgi:hypothetical protein
MKISSSTLSEPKFNEFTLYIQVNTPEEAAKLFAIFNHAWIIDDALKLLSSTEAEAIRDEIKKHYPDVVYDYNPWHSSISDVFSKHLQRREC